MDPDLGSLCYKTGLHRDTHTHESDTDRLLRPVVISNGSSTIVTSHYSLTILEHCRRYTQSVPSAGQPCSQENPAPRRTLLPGEPCSQENHAERGGETSCPADWPGSRGTAPRPVTIVIRNSYRYNIVIRPAGDIILPIVPEARTRIPIAPLSLSLAAFHHTSRKGAMLTRS